MTEPSALQSADAYAEEALQQCSSALHRGPCTSPAPHDKRFVSCSAPRA